ncbi:WD40 repeat-containing protein [Leptolyngbya sp. PCC 7375]|nr:WD40 repeat-containing protein [Leptolyngbya sp. PCC 7375]
MAKYYQIGGSLDYDAPTYIERQADKDLYTALLAGEFCYIFNSRQMGKSSLMVRSWHRLQAEGHRCAVLDVTNIGSDNITPEQWYRGMMGTLALQVNLQTRDIRTWWDEHSHLSLTQILSQFIELLLAQCPDQRLFIFVDEVDSLLNLPFSVDDFFALIRFCYNRRAVESAYKQLTFAIFGVAAPADLIADKQRTPFNIGRAIVLNGFTLGEAAPLAVGLEIQTPNTQTILQKVLNWTGGQPFLTQKVCQLLMTSSQVSLNEPLSIPPGMEHFWVDSVVRDRILTHWESQDEPEHLRTIRDRLLYDDNRAGRLLGLYQRWLEGQAIPTDDSRDQIDLLLSGLMVRHDGHLEAKNQIYENVFTLEWVQRQLTALRPYSEMFNAWVTSQQIDESRLLRGQALHDAQVWARGKSLSDLDYRFLSLSQEQEQEENQRARQLEKAQAAKQTARLQRILLGLTSGALVIVSLLGLATFWQYRRAVGSEQAALLSEQDARLNEIRALISSADGQFASHHELEALIDAIKAKRKLETLQGDHPELTAEADRALNQIVYWMSERNRLSGHKGPVLGVTYSPDGELIATTSGDTTVKLWAKDGQLLHTFEDSSVTFGVAFHPQRPVLATTNLDGHLKLWDLDANSLLQTIEAHEGAAWDLAFSSKGDFLVSGGADKQVKVWDLDGTLRYTLGGHEGMVWQVAVSPVEQTIASASLDNTAKLWSSAGQLLSTLRGATKGSSLWSVAFNPAEATVATGGDEAVIQLWQPNGDATRTLKGHTKRIEHLAFSTDGRILASGGLDQTLRIWGKKGIAWRIVQTPGDIRNLNFSPTDSRSVVISGTGTTAELRQWETPLLKTIFLGDDLWDIAISPSGEKIVSGDSSRPLVWDTERNIVTNLEAEQGTLFGFDVSPDGQMIAAVGTTGTVRLWTQDGQFLRDLEGHEFQSWDVAFSPDSQRIAAGAEDGSIRIWTVEGQLIRHLKGQQRRVYRVAFSRDGQQLVSSGSGGTVQIWNTTNGELLHDLEAHGADIFALSVSPDGQFFITASVDQTAKLWRWDGTLVRTFDGHTNGLFGVDFSIDGQMVATAGSDNTLVLWSIDGNKIKTLYGNGAGFKSVKFSPNGELLTVAEDGNITHWSLDEVLTLNELSYACDWIADYLRTNVDVVDSDRTLCQGLPGTENNT